MTLPYPDNLSHLQGALLGLNLELHRQVLRWRAQHHDMASPDELAGMYLSDREVDALLDGLYAAEAPPQAPEFDRAPIETLNRLIEEARLQHIEREAASLAAGVPLRLPALVDRLGLTEWDGQVALLALAPELDRRYERLFGYLNDDLTRRWLSVDLALQLFTFDLPGRIAARAAFGPDSPLVKWRVLRLIEDGGPLISCGVRLDGTVANFLLGLDAPDPLLEDALVEHDSALSEALVDLLPGEAHLLKNHLAARRAGRLLPNQVQRPAANLVLIETPDEALGVAAAAFAAGHNLAVLDARADNLEETLRRAVRECLLDGRALAVTHAEAAAKPGAMAQLLRAPLATFLISAQPPAVDEATLRLQLLPLTHEGREQVWAASLNGASEQVDMRELAGRFRLSSGQIAAAAHQAERQATVFDGPVNARGLYASCSAQTNKEIAQLAQPIHSIHCWDDLVLPAATKAQLRSLEHWVHHRHQVYYEWGFANRLMLGRGLAVLFSGSSGTGKTMTAGILAAGLELDLYRIDLSTVVSKYIGETEKNLSKVFDAAESASAVLFFDEADALFGKRSEIKDAHDRYANIEVSYLLQRMEAYDGVAILATNFRQNLDQAFLRRLHMIIEFPLPNAQDRERIWQNLLSPQVPLGADVDLGYLARQFTLSGGNIKNCSLNAAFAAAAEAGPVTMRHLVQAVARELEKTNQPLVRTHFGEYYKLIRTGEEG